MAKGTYTPGRFVWHELTTQDPAKSRAFYAELFGWTFALHGPQYAEIMRDAAAIGGMVQASDRALPTFWLPYASVLSVEGATAQAERAGASRMLGPTDVGHGRFTVLRDPLGAWFAVWRDAHGDPVESEQEQAEPGTFVWDQLNTPDAAASFELYSRLFGWTREGFPEQPELMLLQRDDRQVASLMQGPKGMPAHWLTYVAIEHLSATGARAERLGGKVMVERVAVPGLGAFSVLQDTLGGVIAVFEAAR